MAGRPSVGYQVVISTIALGMVATLLASLGGFWKMSLSFNHLLLYATIAIAYGWISWRSPWLSGLLALLGTGAAVLLLLYDPTWNAYLQAVVQALVTLWQHFRKLQFETTFAPVLGYLFLMATAALASLLILREALSYGSAFWSIVGGLWVLGSEWAWFYEKSHGHFVLYAVLGFALWAVSQAAVRDARWRAAGRKIGYRSHFATALIWVAAVTVVATILPDHYDPLDLGQLGDRVQQAIPVLKRLRGGAFSGSGARFSLSVTGFAPNMTTVGGPVRPDDGPALSVVLDQPLSQTLYLRGATFRIYNGHGWEPGTPSPVQVPRDGNLPVRYGIEVPAATLTARITYLAAGMGTVVFNALEPLRVDGLKGNLKTDEDQNTWADRTVARNTPYTLTAQIPTYSSEQVRTLSNSEPGETYEPFLQLPDEASSRVSYLARSLTTRTPHPYDKAALLEAWLRDLPYDLNVPIAPSGQDFVDFFLYDLRRGYCTYFASAMVVMLREVGIPARLVEGFALPASTANSLTSDSDFEYIVPKSQAHAWVEAYFAGYGWITFDPTPRADVPVIDRSTPLPRPTQSEVVPAATGDATPGASAKENLPEDMDPGVADGDSATAAESRKWPWGLIALAAILGFLALAYRRLRSQERVVAAEGGQVVQEVWVKASALLGEFGAARRLDQTPQEYAQSLGARWPALKESAAQVAEDYTAARYSPPGRPVDAGAPGRMKAFWRKVEQALFNRFGWRKYLWRRLRWRRSDFD